eukprot:4585679-Pyramimonas_sp.AAC.3
MELIDAHGVVERGGSQGDGPRKIHFVGRYNLHPHENNPKNLHLTYALHSPDSQSGVIVKEHRTPLRAS